MKKILAVLLALTMVLAFASCGGNTTTSSDETSSVESVADTSSTQAPATEDAALEVLNTIWASYADDEKFAVAGGDADEANMNMEGPGRFGIADTAALDASLALPEASAARIKGAASMMFMMNANSFTCGAFQLNDAADAQTLADEIKAHIATRQWMCGFPDRLYIVSVGDVVVSTFGIADFMNTYVEKVGALEGVQVLVDTPIEG